MLELIRAISQSKEFVSRKNDEYDNDDRVNDSPRLSQQILENVFKGYRKAARQTRFVRKW